tara:strand:- start:158 stop:337 length:180 start_codon:yes stop_codon:yes gene_type:complete
MKSCRLVIEKKHIRGYSLNALSKAITIAIKLSIDDLQKEIKIIDSMTKQDWNTLPSMEL